MNTVIVTLYDKSFEKQGIGTEGEEKDILTFHHAAAGWRFPVKPFDFYQNFRARSLPLLRIMTG